MAIREKNSQQDNGEVRTAGHSGQTQLIMQQIAPANRPPVSHRCCLTQDGARHSVRLTVKNCRDEVFEKMARLLW